MNFLAIGEGGMSSATSVSGVNRGTQLAGENSRVSVEMLLQFLGMAARDRNTCAGSGVRKLRNLYL